MTNIKNKLLANGIDLPFPTQQILFHDRTEATDGDRRQQREGWPAGTGEVPKPFGIGRTIGKLAQSEAKPNIVLAGNGTSSSQTPTQNDR